MRDHGRRIARTTARGLLGAVINRFRLLTRYLKLVLPKTAERVEAFLNIAPLTGEDAVRLLPEGHASTSTNT